MRYIQPEFVQTLFKAAAKPAPEAIAELNNLADVAPRRRGFCASRFRRKVEGKAAEAEAAVSAWRAAYEDQWQRSARSHRRYPGAAEKRALLDAEMRLAMVRVLLLIGAHETADLHLDAIRWPQT